MLPSDAISVGTEYTSLGSRCLVILGMYKESHMYIWSSLQHGTGKPQYAVVVPRWYTCSVWNMCS